MHLYVDLLTIVTFAQGRVASGSEQWSFRSQQASWSSSTSLLKRADDTGEAGGQPQDLVNVTSYLTDVEDYMAIGREIGRNWREMAGSEYPAMVGIGVSRLCRRKR
jgi:hypothetical protein